MREHLDGRRIPFQFINVADSSSAKRDFDILRGRGYPLIFVGYRRIVGYDVNGVDQAVKDLL